jgi:hypothetical protein
MTFIDPDGLSSTCSACHKVSISASRFCPSQSFCSSLISRLLLSPLLLMPQAPLRRKLLQELDDIDQAHKRARCYNYGLVLCLPHQRRPRSDWDLPIFNFYALGTCTVQGTLASTGRRSSQSRTSLFRLSFASLLIIHFIEICICSRPMYCTQEM